MSLNNRIIPPAYLVSYQMRMEKDFLTFFSINDKIERLPDPSVQGLGVVCVCRIHKKADYQPRTSFPFSPNTFFMSNSFF